MGKDRGRGRTLKTYGTVYREVDIDNKNPNENTDQGKPPVAFAPGAWTVHPSQPYLPPLLLPSGQSHA